jgi:nicotinamidase/pyrazinamidase
MKAAGEPSDQPVGDAAGDAVAAGGERGAGNSERILVGAHDAIIVVDVQRDFCPGGSLAVPEGDQVIPVINSLLPMFGRWIYSRDWHPADHVSFSDDPRFQNGSWPAHAVQGTAGAEWCAGLEMPMNAILVSKADDPAVEAYSAFQVPRFDLASFLRHRGVDRVFVTGLAADYCVRQTALDARTAGFAAFLVKDAVRGVAEETTAQAFADMEAAGVMVVESAMLEDSGERPAADFDHDGNPLHHGD